MRNIWVIAQKELNSYFVSPVAYLLLTMFAIIFGFFFWNSVGYFNAASLQSQMGGQAMPMSVNEYVIRPLLSNIGVVGLFFIPMISMRLFAEEKHEAIDNLISNAIKYSPIGGKISVQVGQDSKMTAIRVVDEGAGLSPEDLGRLFGRFQRLSAKPTGGESSTGLGLSIVKRIIDMHGGEVTANSAGPGQGSTFTITLPAADV